LPKYSVTVWLGKITVEVVSDDTGQAILDAMMEIALSDHLAAGTWEVREVEA
jgi:hypothetical protein